jgi:HemY protein
MRRVLWIVAAGAIAVAIAWWIATLPGRVAVDFSGFSIETTTPVAVVLAAVALLLLLVLLRLLIALVALPRTLRRWRHRRRQAGGEQAVTRTLVALAAGDAAARRLAERARRLLGDTPQTLLLCAEAGRLAGADAEAEGFYRRLADRDDAAFIGLRGLFRQAIAREDFREAAALARRAEAIHPGAQWLREERTTLAVRTGDWNQALLLADGSTDRVAFATAAAEAEPDAARALKLARQAWQDNPAFAPAALAYARLLRASGRESRAQEAIRAAWKAEPHPDLADFALATLTDPIARVREGGKLAAVNAAHPESQFLLARLSLAAGLTGEARHHAAAARRAGLQQRRLYLLLADLEAAEHGDTEAGRLAQHDALRQAAAAEPDPVWRCEHCGAAHAHWLPFCPACHTPGPIKWATPTRLALPSAG